MKRSLYAVGLYTLVFIIAIIVTIAGNYLFDLPLDFAGYRASVALMGVCLIITGAIPIVKREQSKE